MLIYPEVFFSHKESLSFACWVPLSPPMSERQRKRDRGREVCRLRAFLYSCHAASLFRCFILRQTFSIGFPTIGSPYAFLSLCRVSVVVGYWLFCFSIAILSSMAFGHRKLHMGFGFLYLNFSNTFYNRKQRSVFYFFIILRTRWCVCVCAHVCVPPHSHSRYINHNRTFLGNNLKYASQF